MKTIDDPNFGFGDEHMPNYAFTCPKCKRDIPIYRQLPFLPPPAETEISLRCERPECGWAGIQRGSDARPWPPPVEENA
jgi:hypothetical protein